MDRKREAYYAGGTYDRVASRDGAETTIRYSVSASSHIVIDVYDLTGQSIKRLVEFYHAPGHYTIQWDGTNAVTDIVSSGMYVVSMRAEGMMKTQKIMFLK